MKDTADLPDLTNLDDLWSKLLGKDPGGTSVLTGSFPGSSILREARYDKLAETLNIVFKNASAYTYFKVPENIANGLFEQEKDGKSAGRYFTTKIKGLYGFTTKASSSGKKKGRASTEKEGSGVSSGGNNNNKD